MPPHIGSKYISTMNMAVNFEKLYTKLPVVSLREITAIIMETQQNIKHFASVS